MTDEELRKVLQDRAARFSMDPVMPPSVVHRARGVMVRTGTAAALVLAMLASVAFVIRGTDRGPVPQPDRAEVAVRLVADVRADPHSRDEGTGDDAVEASALRGFAQCMRGQGFDVPDPVFTGEGWTIPGTQLRDTAAWREAALVTCRPSDVRFSGDLVIGGITEAEIRTFTECMRGEGYDVPEPAKSGDEWVFDMRGTVIDMNTDAFQRATFVTCGPRVGGAVP